MTYWQKQKAELETPRPTWAEEFDPEYNSSLPTCLIFGGSGGIGTHLSKALSKHFNVRSLSSTDCDITLASKIADQLTEYLPEVVINLVGINIDSSLTKLCFTDLADMLKVNVEGAHKLIASSMCLWKGFNIPGRFIHISSILSDRPIAGTGMYSASKAYVDNLIKVAALEGAKYGITYNSIQLGYFKYGMCERIPEKIATTIKDKIPVHRYGEIYELVNAINFISNTSYFNGSNMELSGGLQLA